MDGFVCEVVCASGEAIHIGGLCKDYAKQRQLKNCEKLSKISFAEQDDIYDIDYKLATTIGAVFDKEAYVVGASVKVAHIKAKSTGGVLGSPSAPPKSAKEEIELIDNGIYILAIPEGPGVAAKCSKKEMNTVLTLLKQYQKNKTECVQKVTDYFTIKNINHYLIITDGSTATGEQIVLCKAGEANGLPENV